ncbi:MAG: metallophosphoesterase [Actinobacteria bacterium]|nr:metallophosphoesterase [Actinomycetota bacterium]
MKKPRAAGWAAGIGAALGTYAFLEPYRYRLTRKNVPIRHGSPPVTVLHLSDTHLAAGDARLRRFLEQLPGEIGFVPDIVAATGDMIEDDAAIEDLVAVLAGIEARIGRFFVYGSHDYFSPAGPSYLKYFTGGEVKHEPRRRDESAMTNGLESKGWISVINRTEIVTSAKGTIRIAGVDDPYLEWHDTDHIERDAEDDLAIALVHAPDVVSEWALNGFDLVLAGHTHGGQVRVPGFGAVVTNCSLPRALAAGLSRIGRTWLHVSPGLGTGRYTPIRFNCRPEATLLYLEPGG